MDLLLRMAGYGSSAASPHWSAKCAPAEKSIVQELLHLGLVRARLKEVCGVCENLGRNGHYLVGASVLATKDCCLDYDKVLTGLSGKLQSPSPPTLQSIYGATKQYEPALAACLDYLVWIAEENKPEELFVGRLLDECCGRMNVSHGSAKEATDAIFRASFEAFKRTLIPWLAYGLLDTRTDTFFVKEPVYFKEIPATIADSQRAPSHFSASLVDKIAQYGYMRRFLGLRSRNVLHDCDLEDQLLVLASELRDLSWKHYKSTMLESVVDRFGDLYSKALYIDIFERCQVFRIIEIFHQTFHVALVDLFDEFIMLADPHLQRTPVGQTFHVVNSILDRCFENTPYLRTFSPSIANKDFTFPVEQTAEKGYDCVYFALQPGATPGPQSVTGWDDLQLTFKIQNPLDWFFHPKTIKKYQRMFRQLLRLKRLTCAFSILWHNLRAARWSKRVEFADYSELFHWQYNSSHAFTAIQEFIQEDVIGVAWIDFRRRIRETKDYLRLMEAHEAFLSRIAIQSCIDNDAIRGCISNMTKLALQICDAMNLQLRKPRDMEIDLDEIRGLMLDLEKSMCLFVELVGNATELSSPMLPYLNLKLNFNGRPTKDGHLAF